MTNAIIPATLACFAFYVACLPGSPLHAQKSGVKTKRDRIPPPTVADFRYGTHERQVFDFWKAGSSTNTPVVFLIHGGGFLVGDKSKNGRIDWALNAGISVVAINYRYTSQAEGIQPPVKASMMDAARALQTVRSKAGEWGIDKLRIGATGGSSGGCMALWLAYHPDQAIPDSPDPIARESTRLWCVAANDAQTTLDPQQMKEWTPNSVYGGHAFDVADDPAHRISSFEKFLAKRESLLPWISEFSPYALASIDDPPTFLWYGNAPTYGKDAPDPAHTANFGVMLKEHLLELGLECDLVYPGIETPGFHSAADYLVDRLKRH